MPTVFTHALVGAALGAAAPRGAGRGRAVAAAAALAALPDLDVVGFALGVPYAHALGHRGLSHAPVFALAAGALAAWAWRPRLGGAERRRLAALLALATASHGLLDAFTDAGLGVAFALPFSDARFFFPWRPLATSPIGVEAFFGRRAWDILANEVRLVWLPTLVLLGLGAALAQRRRRAGMLRAP